MSRHYLGFDWNQPKEQKLIFLLFFFVTYDWCEIISNVLYNIYINNGRDYYMYNNSSKVYIFLDINGVLNTKSTFQRQIADKVPENSLYYDIEPSCVLAFREFIQTLIEHNYVPEIVLSSSWKEKEQGLFRINCVFQICHVPLINEVTPSLKNANRVGEIRKWMKDHNVSKEQVIIFDDEPNLNGIQDRLVSTSNLSGFQQKHVEMASKLLFG